MKFIQFLDHPIFSKISIVADEMQQAARVIGGFVRDCFLSGKSGNDLDIVVLGSGIDFAGNFAVKLNPRPAIKTFADFGVAKMEYGDMKIDFVGARKDIYNKDSRYPLVESGSFEDDQKRRDFTINAMAFDLRKDFFGDLIDPFNGISDLGKRIILTPVDPDLMFYDDPLRMMRAIRFATVLDFTIQKDCYEAISKNAGRLCIVPPSNILNEMNLIMQSPGSSIGLDLSLIHI